MAEQAHTHSDGPWKIHKLRGKTNVYDANGCVVCTLASWTPQVDRADASLIVAAPDLLAALKLARECIAYCRRAHKDAQSGDGFPVEIILDAAIARATAAPTHKQHDKPDEAV